MSLRSAAIGRIRATSLVGLGTLLGVAIFEKLVAVALVVPLLLLMHAGWGPLSVRDWATPAAGGAVGGLPLLIANAYSYAQSGLFVSLANLGPDRPRPRLPVMTF